MKDEEDSILDRFDEDQPQPWFQHWSIVFGPIILLAVGALFRIQNWPFASLIIAIALVLILARSIIFFFSKKRKTEEWFYFTGRISLITVLAMDFAFLHVDRKILVGSLALFGIGVLIYVFKKKDPAEEEKENEEDDY